MVRWCGGAVVVVVVVDGVVLSPSRRQLLSQSRRRRADGEMQRCCRGQSKLDGDASAEAVQWMQQAAGDSCNAWPWGEGRRTSVVAKSHGPAQMALPARPWSLARCHYPTSPVTTHCSLSTLLASVRVRLSFTSWLHIGSASMPLLTRHSIHSGCRCLTGPTLTIWREGKAGLKKDFRERDGRMLVLDWTLTTAATHADCP